MKALLIIGFGLLMVTSCGNGKKVSDKAEQAETEVTETSEEVMEEVKEEINEEAEQASGLLKADGIIRDKTSEEGCGFLIEVTNDNVTKLLQPQDLDKKYLVEGKVVKFTYRMSRRPSTCLMALPIVVDKIIE